MLPKDRYCVEIRKASTGRGHVLGLCLFPVGTLVEGRGAVFYTDILIAILQHEGLSVAAVADSTWIPCLRSHYHLSDHFSYRVYP